MVTAALTAGAPAMAGAVVGFARNAGKVDGKSAVGAGASIAGRKGKLVATSARSGRLPDNIIAKAPNADKIDGKDSSSFALKAKLVTPGSVNQLTNPVNWGKLLDVPPELADGADAYGPAAYAHVKGDGTLLPGDASNVEAAGVSNGTAAGTYCFDLAEPPVHVLVTPDLESAPGALASTARPFATTDAALVSDACPAGTWDAVVSFVKSDGIAQRTWFFVSFL